MSLSINILTRFCSGLQIVCVIDKYPYMASFSSLIDFAAISASTGLGLLTPALPASAPLASEASDVCATLDTVFRASDVELNVSFNHARPVHLSPLDLRSRATQNSGRVCIPCGSAVFHRGGLVYSSLSQLGASALLGPLLLMLEAFSSLGLLS